MLIFPQLIRAYLNARSHFLLAALRPKVKQAAGLSEHYGRRSDDELREDLASLRTLVRSGSKPAIVEIPLLAIVREAARRTVDMYPYEEQLLAALLLARQKVIQMDTGEGKTLVAPFFAILENLYERQVVVVTANDYLALRDAEWMAPLYEFLGVRNSVVLGSYSNRQKTAAYSCDVVYVSNDRLVFDYLTKHHALGPNGDLPIPKSTVIIDEIDSVLLDSGGKSYQLVNPVNFQPHFFPLFDGYVGWFTKDLDFSADPNIKDLEFTSSGHTLLNDIVSESGLSFPEVLFYTKCALSAHHLYFRDKDYLVQDHSIVVIDILSGRPQFGSTFSFGVQQAIEGKEGLNYTYPNTAINKITLRGFYRTFDRRSGMSGSAAHNALEFRFDHGLDVVVVPPHKPSIRINLTDVVFRTKDEQIKAVVDMAKVAAENKQPVLIGTTNVEDAERVSVVCSAQGLNHSLLTARNHFEESNIIADAGRAGRITIAARMAGRGVDIKVDQEALGVGGLHIVGVGRHEERRLDEQLQGRCARQGDPGSSQFILSLDDDLMRAFAKKWVGELLKTLGMEEGVPIESPMIMRRIKSAQRALTQSRFYQRQSSIVSDRFVEKLRAKVFARRGLIVRWGLTDSEIQQTIRRCVERIISEAKDESSSKIQSFGSRLGVTVPPHLYLSRNGDPGALCEGLTDLIGQQYSLRRQKALAYGPIRERLIFIRSIDLTWTLFLDEMENKLDGLLFANARTPSFESIREIGLIFAGYDDRIFEDIEDRVIFYLMRIDNAHALEEIKYWRGFGISHGWGSGDDMPDDGIQQPDSAPEIFENRGAGAASLGLGISAAGLELSPPKLSINDYVLQYIRDLASSGRLSEDLERVKAVLQSFKNFVANRDLTPDEAFASVHPYLGSLSAQGVPIRARHKQRQILIGFFGYLQRRNALSAGLAVTRKAKVSGWFKGFGKLLVEPMFLLQLIFLCTFVFVCRVTALHPLPYIHAGLRAWVAKSLSNKSVLFRLLNDLLLGGALSRMSLALLGPLPVILTRLLLRVMKRDRGPVPLVFCLMLSVVLSLLASMALTSSLTVTHPLPLFAKFIAGGSLTFATGFIVLMIWGSTYAELLDGLLLLLLVNSSVVLYNFYSSLRSIYGNMAVWLPTLVCWFGVCTAFVLYRRYSRVSVNLVQVGKFDFNTGLVKRKPITLFAETLYNPNHYLYGLLVVLIVGRWLRALASSVGGGVVPHRYSNFLSYSQFPLYLGCVWLFAYRQAILEFNPENMRRFLEARNWFLENAKTLSEGVTLLVSRVKKILFRNLLFESAIVGLALLGTGWLWGGTGIGNEEQIFLATCMAISCYLFLAVLTRLGTSFIGHAETPLLAMPAGQDKEADVPWAKKVYNFLCKPSGIVAFILTLYKLIQFMQWAFKQLEWLVHRLK
jgi:preprotein translocase subunit SecA